MNIVFDSIQSYMDAVDGVYTFGRCRCGGVREMVLLPFAAKIKDKKIEIVDCPILKCNNCGDEKLGNLMPHEICSAYYELEERGNDICRIVTQNNQRFEYAKEAEYEYDCRDLNIPGLNVDADPSHFPGFSCPVYFDRKVLNSFYFDDDYQLFFVSESYGRIAKKGSDGWDWDWQIVFGVNCNDKVIMFLGDLAKIDFDDRAIYWLKSYNIASDHIIVDSELYRAQLYCTPCDPIIEKRILCLRDSFYKRIKDKHGVSLFHLEQEVDQKREEISKPVSYARKEIKENIVILDGLLNEGINCAELRKLYKVLIWPLPSNADDLKSRKLLEGIIALKQGQENAKFYVAPLFYLNDLRVCFAHLISEKEVEAIEGRIVEAYGLQSFTEYRKLYDSLIDSLYQLYQYLNIEEF